MLAFGSGGGEPGGVEPAQDGVVKGADIGIGRGLDHQHRDQRLIGGIALLLAVLIAGEFQADGGLAIIGVAVDQAAGRAVGFRRVEQPGQAVDRRRCHGIVDPADLPDGLQPFVQFRAFVPSQSLGCRLDGGRLRSGTHHSSIPLLISLSSKSKSPSSITVFPPLPGLPPEPVLSTTSDRWPSRRC